MPPRWRSLASMASATTRDIAALAGQNIAAITYYFGSKRIYTACAQWIVDFLAKNFARMLKKSERLFSRSLP